MISEEDNILLTCINSQDIEPYFYYYDYLLELDDTEIYIFLQAKLFFILFQLELDRKEIDITEINYLYIYLFDLHTENYNQIIKKYNLTLKN